MWLPKARVSAGSRKQLNAKSLIRQQVSQRCLGFCSHRFAQQEKEDRAILGGGSEGSAQVWQVLGRDPHSHEGVPERWVGIPTVMRGFQGL